MFVFHIMYISITWHLNTTIQSSDFDAAFISDIFSVNLNHTTKQQSASEKHENFKF